MYTQIWKRVAALLTIGVLLTTGCTSLQGVPLSRDGQGIQRPDIKVGESVVVTRKDGTQQKFTVLKIEDDALIGHKVRINYADMTALEAHRKDKAQSRKALLIGGAVLGAVAIAAATSGGGGGSGGY
jgi:hypothetical protein